MHHYIVHTGVFLIILVVFGLSGGVLIGSENDSPPACAQTHRPDQQPLNIDRVQIYTNIGIATEKACNLGVTVNGLWNGWGMKNPVASMHPELFLWRFKEPGDYIEAMHASGFWYGTTVSNVYAHPSQLKRQPALKQGIDRTVTGKIFEMDGGWYLGKQPFMCQNSSEWYDAMLARAKQMVDAGSDIIVFDEPFGDTFFASLPAPEFPGFSDMDLQILADALTHNFAPEALGHQFDLTVSPTPNELRQRFAESDWAELSGMKTIVTQNDPTLKDIVDASTSQPEASITRLWRYFRQVQQNRNFDVRQRLIQDIQAYALKVRGARIPIGANLAELESYTFLSQQLPVLYLAELFDFLAVEMSYRSQGERFFSDRKEITFTVGTQGKWFPRYALGKALFGPHRTIVYPSNELMEIWIEPGKKIRYLCNLLLEAYAAQGSLIIPLADFGEKGERTLQQYTTFVRQYADLYEHVEPIAPVGVLYAHSADSPARHWSYLGVAQALYESAIPFSVLYTSSTGQGYPPPSLAELKPYTVLVVPITTSMAPQTVDVINRYAETGGTVVMFDPLHPFMVSREPGFHAYGIGGFLVVTTPQAGFIGADYFNTYDETLRAQIADAVRAYLPNGSPLVIPENSREWSVLAYTQSERQRAVLHVLNYDYFPDRDEFLSKQNLSIQMRMADIPFLQGQAYRCTAYSPNHSEPISLDCRENQGYLKFTLPNLLEYELILIEKREAS